MAKQPGFDDSELDRMLTDEHAPSAVSNQSPQIIEVKALHETKLDVLKAMRSSLSQGAGVNAGSVKMLAEAYAALCTKV